MEEQTLFRVGQFVETRSFQQGYRGAWFNCKIVSSKGAAVSLQYCDFPGEKLHWTKIYQKPQGRKPIKGKKELMLRPSFPPIYCESQLPNASTISGVAVIVNDVWCVGDLVDWKFDDCYWSGKITKVLGNGKYQIDLLPHPFGEGASYEGSSDQLRPSLEWSPQKDWTLPTPPRIPGWNSCRSPAQIINPTKQESFTKTAHTVNNRKKEVEGKTDVVSQPNILPSASSGSSPLSNGFSQMEKGQFASKETKTAEKAGNIDVKDGGVSTTNFFAGISSLQARKASLKLAGNSSENGNQHNGGFSKKIGNDGSIPINTVSKLAEAATSLPASGLVDRVSEPLNVSSKEIKKLETDVNVRRKQPFSTSTPMAVNIGDSSGHLDAGPSKRMRTENFSLNFTNSNSIEVASLDLEELVNKVKWIKGILQFGLPNLPPSWKFIEHRGSSMPK